MRRLINNDRCAINFLDGNAVATWVRDYPGMIPWVRERIGAPLHGWRSYGNWTSVPATASSDYHLDEELTLSRVSKPQEQSTGLAAIKLLQDQLRVPQTSVRLVGLSGVGKTRFVQALFESSVGMPPSTRQPYSIRMEKNRPHQHR